MRCSPNNRNPRGGFTLVEMMLVVVVISIMSVAIVGEMHGTFQDALLRSTSRELAEAFNSASSRAISVSRPYRILFDRTSHRYMLEQSRRGGTDFFPAKDVPIGSGKIDSRIAFQILEPGFNAPDDSGQEPPENSEPPDNFQSVQSEEAVTFYPDGTADERQIMLTDQDGYCLALRVNPVTSRVQVTALGHGGQQ